MDRTYAYGVVHDFGTVWKFRGFLTTAGLPISRQTQVIELMEACTLPTAGAFIKVRGKGKLGCCQGAAKQTEKLMSAVSLSPQK